MNRQITRHGDKNVIGEGYFLNESAFQIKLSQQYAGKLDLSMHVGFLHPKSI